MGEWEEAFSNPGEWVVVGYEVPGWVGTLTRLGASAAVRPGTEALSLEASEMGEGEASAWGRDGGWPAFMAWYKRLARHLGGTVEFETLRNTRTGQERHRVRYNGPKVEDI
jgi:hypothetical protein